MLAQDRLYNKSILEDKDYNPKDQQQLCTNLKYKTGGKVRKELVDDYVPLDYCTDGNDEEEINLLDKIAYVWWSNDNNVGYSRKIHYLNIILGRVNVCELLCGGADFQRRLVHLLARDEIWTNSNKGYCIKPLEQISKEYARFYGGKAPSIPQISAAIKTIRNVLLNAVSNSSDINTHYMLSCETERIIEQACTQELNADNEYCSAYNNLMDRIRYTSKVICEKGFEPDIEKITDIALFEYEEKDYWHFKKIGEKYRIEKYNKTGEKTYSPCRKKRIDFCQPPVCYTVGNCVIFGDVDSKKLYYLTKEYRLFEVIQRDNKYYGFCLSN